MPNYPAEVERAIGLNRSVIPVGLDKRPTIKTWKPFQDHPPTPELLSEWAAKRPPAWAMVTGAVSGVVVLDFDGDEGKRALDNLQVSPHVQTGSGGFHAYYRHPGRQVLTLNSKSGKQLKAAYPGVDIRADGGYAVFCGRNDHGSYVQCRDMGDLEPWDRIPAALRTMICPPDKAPDVQNPAERFLQDALQRAGSDGRNDTGFWLACQLRDSDLAEAEAGSFMRRYQQGAGALDRHGKESPYTWSEAEASLRQAYSSAKREPASKPGSTLGGESQLAPSAEEQAPLAPVGLSLPAGCEMLPEGLFYSPSTTEPAIKLCDPFDVPYITHDSRGEDPGKLLRFADRYGRLHEAYIAEAMLVGEGSEWRQTLARSGLRMSTNRRAAGFLREALYHLSASGRATRVSQIGWHGDVFVTPAYQVPDSGREVFLHDDQTGRDYHFERQGRLEEWRDNVSRLCIGNPLLMFAVGGAFAPILLRLKSGMGGGFHFGGSTSTGKTTTLTVASSVWGNPKGFIQSWNATKNALEALAHSHNHSLLALDEVKEMDPKEAGNAAYMLGNGYGKERSNVNAQLRQRLCWELIFYSTGELGYIEHSTSGGQRAYGGQALRVLEIPSDRERFGCFDELHGYADGALFAQAVAEAARSSFGTPAHSFLTAFLSFGAEAVRSRLNALMADFRNAYRPSGTASDADRAVERFAFVAAAGELATEWGLTGWRKDDALRAASVVLDLWFQGRGTRGSYDEHQALKQFRANLFRLEPSHFERCSQGTSESEQRLVKRLGFVSEANNRKEYQFPKDQGIAPELRGPYPEEMIIKALDRQGALIHEDGRHTTKRKIPGIPPGTKARCYVISAEKLLATEPDSDQEQSKLAGDSGTA